MMPLFVAYLRLSLSLSLLGGMGLCLWGLARIFPGLFRPRALLRLQWALLIAAFVVPFLPGRADESFRFEAPVKIWSASTFRGSEWKSAAAPVVTAGTPVKLPLDLSLILLGLVACAFAVGWGIEIARLYWLARRATLLRRQGRIEILVSGEVPGPLSFYLPGRAVVCVPEWILERPTQFKIALRHELQHHRARDPRSAHVLTLVKVLFFWNPIVPLLERAFQEFQEMACDEALIGHRGLSASTYSSCLIEVAQRSLARPRYLAGTPGFACFVSRGHLKRRILNMKLKTNLHPQVRRWAMTGVAALGLGAVALTSFASRALVQDSRVTLAQAQAMAVRAAKDSDFPIVVNEQVVEQLNRYVSTPDGRAFIRESLERLEALRPILERKAQAYEAPLELLAIPIVESGYHNLAERANPLFGAGVWQFLRQTARNYGLRVGAGVDERLDVEKESDAAMRYLQRGKLLYGDWLLAVLAFNWGEAAVQAGIEATHSRDAFLISERFPQGDANYLAKVMAAILILKNP